MTLPLERPLDDGRSALILPTEDLSPLIGWRICLFARGIFEGVTTLHSYDGLSNHRDELHRSAEWRY